MCSVDRELYHFGVKGMKWGIRKYQNKDGTLTDVGRKRYSEIEAKPKSKYRTGLENKYRNDGLSKEAAAIRADRIIRAKKIIAGVAVTSLLAVGSYVAYKKYSSEFCDTILKKGTIVQNVSIDNLDVNREFYGAHKTADKSKYSTEYAAQLLARYRKDGVRINSLMATKDIKIAGKKAGIKALSDMYKTEDGRKALNDVIDTYEKTKSYIVVTPKAKKALENFASLKGKKNPTEKDFRRAYDGMNLLLVGKGHIYESAKDGIISRLQERGYSGLKDINDQKLSGYKASSATIYFAKSLVKAGEQHKTAEKVITEHLKRTARDVSVDTVKNAAISVGAFATVSTLLKEVDIATNSGEYSKEGLENEKKETAKTGKAMR